MMNADTDTRAVMLPVAQVAGWLLESLETIDEMARNKIQKASTKVAVTDPEVLAGETFLQAVNDWVRKGNTLEGLARRTAKPGEKPKSVAAIRRNFKFISRDERRRPVAIACCNAMGIDLEQLFEGQIVFVGQQATEPQGEQHEIVSIAQQVALLPKDEADEAARFLRRFLPAKSNR